LEEVMKVSKWGNSLAIRLPADLVERLGVKEGDELEATPGMREEAVTFQRKKTLEEMWARVDAIRSKLNLPAGTTFTRADAYDDDEY
jgi:antitoxin MazE